MRQIWTDENKFRIWPETEILAREAEDLFDMSVHLREVNSAFRKVGIK